MSLGGDTPLDTASSPNIIGNGNGNGHGNNGETAGRPATPEDATTKAVRDVTSSEIGISTLLNRLKQSIASAKEFASFLKKRQLEIVSANQSIGMFGVSLHQMHDDLMEMASNMEKGRKHWKNTGLAAEQRAADAEAAMRKSKVKYDALADEYDRARTGDRQSGKIFGLKGPKSAAQHEEDLLRKVQAADADYASKSKAEAVKALEDLIQECDSALTLQMQKFASFNEKLLLSNGLNISPIRAKEQGTPNRSLREAVHAIDNVKDLSNYISSFVGKVPSRVTEIKYERNTVLQPSQNIGQRQSDPNTLHSRQGSGMPPQPSPSAHAPAPSGPPSGSPLGPPSGATFSPGPVPNSGNNTHLAPLKPVFGLSLEELFERDGSAVPMIVYQCIQAVDLFGLEVEGIYRLSGTASHIMKIKAMFDNDASKVDFHPLLTVEQYPAFIEAAKHDDEIVRRDSLHAIINGLPDPNYATLRALTLHLNRVQESSASNRMNASNLAIVFGPTLMGANTGPNIQDAGWQVRVIHTILDNTYQIFDDD
ncbi:hypothetical protein EYC84_006208 [Monilinia fructicola]|uniref:Rho-GAP domain-containing protein n=1 Tax=Monilinia fructicola TaxID=38448 RepID=A0A5M9KAV8_MONFR|nr:hypothetical protein EYC84_006208 [Monilinia fructicola]